MLSNVKLFINLDSNSKEFEPGEVVKGKVRAKVKKESKCNGLTISLGWKTHGRGNKATEELYKTTLHEGTWQGDQEYEYPFEFTIPAVLPTYRGTYINLDYYLYTTADIPWAFDPTLEKDIIVRAPRHDLRLPDHDYPIDAWWEGEDKRGLRKVLASHRGQPISDIPAAEIKAIRNEVISGGQGADGTLWGAIGCFAVIDLIFNSVIFFVMGAFPLPIKMLVFIIPNLILAGFLFVVIRNAVAQKKIGAPTIKLNPSIIVHPGRELEATLELTPESLVDINSIDLTLQGTEIAISGSGTNKTTHTHIIYTNKRKFTGKTKLQPQQLETFKTKVFLPEHAPFSFYASDNKIQWSANIHIDIPMWPDWTVDIPLICLPTPVACAINGEAEPEGAQQDQAAATSKESAQLENDVVANDNDVVTNDKNVAIAASATEAQQPTSSIPAEFKVLDRAIEQLKECNFSSDRERVFEDFESYPFTFGLLVQSVNETEYSSNLPSSHEGGKTVKGQIANYGATVFVQFESSLNGEVGNLQENDEVECQVKLTGWNEMEQLPILTARFE